MKNVTVKINKRNLNSLIRKTSFNFGGMFISYSFIAIDFYTKKSNTATLYNSVQASQNSWTNYPGFKIWTNCNETKWLKSNVLTACVENLENVICELSANYPNINFKLIGF